MRSTDAGTNPPAAGSDGDRGTFTAGDNTGDGEAGDGFGDGKGGRADSALPRHNGDGPVRWD
jgi:hypothetical protein